jgi:hypothetical protein
VSPSQDGTIVWTNYTYEVTFVEPPPPGRFLGQLTAVDPWEASKRLPIQVRGETLEPLRALPARLIVRLDAEGRGTTLLRVRYRDESLAPEVVAEDPDGSPPVVTPIASDTPGERRFEVAVEGGDASPAGHEYRLLVRDADGRVAPVVVPVLVRREDAS